MRSVVGRVPSPATVFKGSLLAVPAITLMKNLPLLLTYFVPIIVVLQILVNEKPDDDLLFL